MLNMNADFNYIKRKRQEIYSIFEFFFPLGSMKFQSSKIRMDINSIFFQPKKKRRRNNRKIIIIKQINLTLGALLVDRSNEIFFSRFHSMDWANEINMWNFSGGLFCGFMIIMDFVFVDHYFKAQIPRFKCCGRQKSGIIPVLDHTKKYPFQIESTEELTVSESSHNTWTRNEHDKKIRANFISREELWNQMRTLWVNEWVGWLRCPKTATKWIIKMWRFWITIPANTVCITYGHITKPIAEHQIQAHT